MDSLKPEPQTVLPSLNLSARAGTETIAFVNAFVRAS